MLEFIRYPVEVEKPVYSVGMKGDEPITVVSVYMTVGLGALDLEAIKRGLCEALFERVAPNDSRAAIGPFARRFPTMEPVRLEDDYPGYRLTVHGDLLDAAQSWSSVELGKIAIEPKDGGGCNVRFRAQMRGELLEPWVALIGRTVEVTLEAPKALPLPEGHPDDAADDDEEPQSELAMGEAPPADDPFAGADLEAEPIKKRGRRNGAATHA